MARFSYSTFQFSLLITNRRIINYNCNWVSFENQLFLIETNFPVRIWRYVNTWSKRYRDKHRWITRKKFVTTFFNCCWLRYVHFNSESYKQKHSFRETSRFFLWTCLPERNRNWKTVLQRHKHIGRTYKFLNLFETRSSADAPMVYSQQQDVVNEIKWFNGK